MSRAEYARHRGVTWRAVNKKCTEGLLTLLADGLLNVAESDAAWEVDETKQAARGNGGGRTVYKTAEGDEYTKDEEQARKVRAERRLAERKLAVAEKRLVKVEDVEREWFACVRAVRDAILAMPDDISADLAAETDARKVRAILERECRERLEGLGEAEDDAR